MTGERAIIVGQFPRKISVAAVRAQRFSLHSRLELIRRGLSRAAVLRLEIYPYSSAGVCPIFA